MPDTERPGIAAKGDRIEPRRLRGRRWVARTTMCATIALAFSVGVAASHAYDHYTRRADCQRWQANVNRWADVVSNASGTGTPVSF